jgi:hypothetical protein
MSSINMADVVARGAAARRMGFPYLSNPYLELVAGGVRREVDRCYGWWSGWLQEDARRHDTTLACHPLET